MHAGKSSIVDAQFSVFEGQRGKIDKSVLTRPDGRTDYFDTNDQAFSALKQIIESTIKLSENNAKTGKETKLDVYKLRGSQGYIVGKKITSGKFIDLKGGFATAKEAFQHIEDHHGALVEQLEALKQRPSERRAINNDRIGVERRSGNVSAAQFAAAFGFDGRVEFGNSMPQDERQRNLNKAYDAFADLADVLNIPTESISLNGSLGMGFGSRGKGGIGAFAAHFEPDTLAINLTRNNGAGSLGHEWLHALDNYFSRMDGDKAGFISNNPRHPKLAGNAVRPEMRAAWKHVMAEIHASAMAKRSIVADSTRSKDYWSTDIEMVARAFERYLIQKSETKGITNDYLANIVEKDTWDFQEATGLDSYPYPTPEESARINEAFDSMFTALQVKEENGRKVLHSKSGKSRTAEFDALAWHERSTNQDGPVYKNDEFIIAASAHLADAHNGDFASDDGLPMGHAAYLHEDAQVYDFGIFDIDGRRVAEMTAQVDVFGDISAIHDIEVRKELRGSGMGAKIVKSIIANQPDGVQIIDMIPQAREFWRKLGVDYETTGSDSFIQNGTLTRDTYRGDDRGQSRALQSATPRRSFGARAPNGAGITSETSSGAQSSGQERLDSQHTIESIRADLVKANSATARLIQNGKLQIVQSVAELPADIRQSVDGETQAFYDPQTQQAYIVADGLQDDAYPVLLHELGHASKEEGGIFATQAKTLSKILDQASTTQALRDAVDERLADADLDPSHPDYAEERLMYAVEEAAQRNDIGSRTFIRRALDAMRAFYVKAALKFGLPTQLTEQDLYRLAEAELKRMAKAKTPSDNDPSGRSTEQHSAAQHSTAQRSTAQNSNTGILQSKAPNEAAHKVAQSLQSTGSLLASLKEMGADAFSLGLKAVPLHHLVEIYQDWMPSLKAMRRHTEQMFGRQNSLLAESDQMLVRMQKARKAFGQPDMDKLASVMHSATVWGIDPSKKSEASWTYEWRAAHGRLQAKYKTLPKELQQLFVDVRDHYNQRSEQVKDALIEQVDAALGATATAGRVIG
ncbi:LPD5 domain-containing protein [Deefgea sp. CFH1-16]|uniref:LPD5 domain-containing protein n=1 Tax=Deefgea sp. CFH1-16 TaxID=2675457 RepID=UPI001FFD076A|nr:LPD5 domain-containing protein [Deefgea sp. CFH1-16]